MRIHSFLVATALWAGPGVRAGARRAGADCARLHRPATAKPAPLGARRHAVALQRCLPDWRRLRVCRPAGSGPVVYNVVVCFPKQGNVSLVEPQTYLYYMQSTDLVSLPSQNVWKPYNEAAEQTIIGDHKRLWATNFLDDLTIETVDYPVLERRHRQGHRLQHGRAAADQEHDLQRRDQRDRAGEGRRAASRARHHHPSRLVRRPGDREDASPTSSAR